MSTKPMTRQDELAAVHAALDTVLTWPDSVRAAVEGRGAGAGPYDPAAELKTAAPEPPDLRPSSRIPAVGSSIVLL
jgi:hypothetical protein